MKIMKRGAEPKALNNRQTKALEIRGWFNSGEVEDFPNCVSATAVARTQIGLNKTRQKTEKS